MTLIIIYYFTSLIFLWTALGYETAKDEDIAWNEHFVLIPICWAIAPIFLFDSLGKLIYKWIHKGGKQ